MPRNDLIILKWLLTAISAVLAMIGAMAIATETHTGYARYQGVRTLTGDDAVWMGSTCLVLAALPLMVWLPKRWIGASVSIWWAALMIWLFGPFFLR